MSEIHFRIADLRRAKRLTQGQLADVVGVSFQTISKWENGTAMPDVTYLPKLAEFFEVSVDQLLGLVPLPLEAYRPTATESAEFWEQKLEYLVRSRKNSFNDDYAEFLVKNVWKIDHPVNVLDCGCGLGFLGALFLPYLPKGSTYTGIDQAEKLIEEARKIYEGTEYDMTFQTRDVNDYHVAGKYDVVFCKAVLRHLNDPKGFLKKIMTFAKEGGLVVCIDSNREFECDGLYVDGMDYFALCRHDGMDKNWRTELEQQGRDYAVAIRTAHMMRELGLREVDVRMNDKVAFVTPQDPDYERIKQDFLQSNDWCTGQNAEMREYSITQLVSHGMTRQEAEAFCDRNVMIAEFFKQHPDAGYSFFKGTMISYGRKYDTKASE